MKHSLIYLCLSFFLLTFLSFGRLALGADNSKFFPATNMGNSGMIGSTGDTDKFGNTNEEGDSPALLSYIPILTNLLLWVISPIVAGMFIFAGIQFVYAGGDEEQLNASKQFFQYGIMGIIFIFASFSLMAALYKIIKV